MIYGATVKAVEDIDLIRGLGLGLGEIVFRNADMCDFWVQSGLRSNFGAGFLLIAHAPKEGPPNDPANIWDNYMPALEHTIRTCETMGIHFLTIHFWLDARFVRPDVREQKIAALGEILAFGKARDVTVALENLSEQAHDFAEVLEAVPGLAVTLDVGHAQLLTEVNTSFEIIARMGECIKHVHLHDNHGGNGVNDDLHLAVGRGAVDFPRILKALLAKGYDGTVTFEVEKEDLIESLDKVKRMVEG
ncbi:MAG: sugar phosphate isomerase/epimerase family protein, partial [Pseudomonadota bacterium]